MKNYNILVKDLRDKKEYLYICGRCPHLPTFLKESWTKNFNFCERNYNFTFCERNYLI